MNGGDGNDTLRVAGGTGGVLLDFTRIGAGEIRRTETINLANQDGSGSNGILLSEDALTDLAQISADPDGVIYITGNLGDTYELCGNDGLGTLGGWTITASDASWCTYANTDGKTVKVSRALTRVIAETDAADTIAGGAEDKVMIRAEEGNDTVNGGSGNETIYGGTGKDTVRSGAGDDIIYGEDGDDTLYGGSGASTGWRAARGMTHPVQ